MFTIGDVAKLASSFFLPIAAGGFIYIAVADLIPELHKTKDTKHSIMQIVAVVVGVVAMVLLTYVE